MSRDQIRNDESSELFRIELGSPILDQVDREVVRGGDGAALKAIHFDSC